jgi:Asp-tRNA(Asn)/Glu-tRNA(Gln) amidotransferase A subunit family amidase
MGSVGAMAETTWLDATAQADLVRRGEVSPKELVEAAIARIEAVNPRLDAVVWTRFDAARQEAGGDLPDGPFRGVPILYKDLGCTVAGEPTTFGLGPLREMAWPVTSYLAEQFRAAELGWFTAAGPQQEKERIISFIPYTAQFNVTGQPAISLPLHWTPAGLPVGVQLAAAYGREDLLIRVASQLEQAAPWSDRYPPIHA